MRIISGTLGGRQFDSPKKSSVHPMSEKVRGAIFNALGDINGLSVLDAFSGSGALSFEAASRGAGQVVAIDSDKSAQKIISSNVKLLGLDSSVKLIRANTGAWLATASGEFDLVLLDPPYNNIQPKLLTQLAARVSIKGLVVLSLPPSADFSLKASEFELLTSKDYGDASLIFYRRLG